MIRPVSHRPGMVIDRISPIPEGQKELSIRPIPTLDEANEEGVHSRSARAFALLVESIEEAEGLEEAPCSNTGVKGPQGVSPTLTHSVDFCSWSFLASELQSVFNPAEAIAGFDSDRDLNYSIAYSDARISHRDAMPGVHAGNLRTWFAGEASTLWRGPVAEWVHLAVRQFFFAELGFYVSRPTGRGMHGFTNSCVIATDADSEVGMVAGVVLFGGESQRDMVHVSLSGVGCLAVSCAGAWDALADKMEALQSRLTRIDICFDDVDGKHGTWDEQLVLAEAGGYRSKRGKKSEPSVQGARSKGRSLYQGSKGHKELCIYEKGKQLGNPNSLHVRYELRLWAAQLELSSAMLRAPLTFLRAQPGFAWIPGEGVTVVEYKKRMLAASAHAFFENFSRQAGSALALCQEIFGDRLAEVLPLLERDSVPVRFRHLGNTVESVASAVKQLYRDETKQGAIECNA